MSSMKVRSKDMLLVLLTFATPALARADALDAIPIFIGMMAFFIILQILGIAITYKHFKEPKKWKAVFAVCVIVVNTLLYTLMKETDSFYTWSNYLFLYPSILMVCTLYFVKEREKAKAMTYALSMALIIASSTLIKAIILEIVPLNGFKIMQSLSLLAIVYWYAKQQINTGIAFKELFKKVSRLTAISGIFVILLDSLDINSLIELFPSIFYNFWNYLKVISILLILGNAVAFAAWRLNFLRKSA